MTSQSNIWLEVTQGWKQNQKEKIKLRNKIISLSITYMREKVVQKLNLLTNQSNNATSADDVILLGDHLAPILAVANGP